MAHEFETGFSVREKPWHGLGIVVQDAPTSREALRLAGLDWVVEQRPVIVDGNEVPNYKANVRNTDNSVLGIVTDRYRIVQNTEAFDFTDSLIGDEVRYETAGSLRKGKTIWLLAKMPEQKILDDAIDPYICFSNSHDGTGAIKVCMTPIRVVCNNTLNLALNNASRTWSTKHIGDISAKLAEAKHTLMLANDYMDSLAIEADHLANSSLSNDEIFNIIKELFPIDKDDSDRQKNNVMKIRQDIIACYFAPDLVKFANTKWGVVNAVADWCGHAEPARNTAEYRDNNWGRIMGGHPVLDKAYQLVGATA